MIYISNQQTSLLPTVHDFLDSYQTICSEMRAKLDLISSEIQKIMSKKPWREGHNNTFSILSASLMNLVEGVRSN